MAKLSMRRQGLRNKRERYEFEPYVCHRYEQINGELVLTERTTLAHAAERIRNKAANGEVSW